MIPKIIYLTFATSIAYALKAHGKSLIEKTSFVAKQSFALMFAKQAENFFPKPRLVSQSSINPSQAEIQAIASKEILDKAYPETNDEPKSLLDQKLQEYRKLLKNTDTKDSLEVASFVKNFIKDASLKKLQNKSLENFETKFHEIIEENKKIEDRFLNVKIQSLKLFKPLLNYKFTSSPEVIQKVEQLDLEIQSNLFFPFLDAIEKPLCIAEYEIEKAKFTIALNKALKSLEIFFEKSGFSNEKLNFLDDLLQTVFLKYLTKVEDIDRAFLLFPKICSLLDMALTPSPFQIFETPQNPPLDLELKHQILEALYG